MAELTKLDTSGLLKQEDPVKKKQRVVDFIKTKGFTDEADLMAKGTAADKVLLQKYKDLSVIGKKHHDDAEAWLNLINSLVDKVKELNGRINALEKKRH